MRTPRTHEMIARSAALRHVKKPEDLDYILNQFPEAHRRRLLERLRPHLDFDPTDGLHKTDNSPDLPPAA